MQNRKHKSSRIPLPSKNYLAASRQQIPPYQFSPSEMHLPSLAGKITPINLIFLHKFKCLKLSQFCKQTQ